MLSAVARARGQRAGQGAFFVLSANLTAAAEEILTVLEQNVDPPLLEAVIAASMDPGPATASPAWAEPLWRDPEALGRIGRKLGESAPLAVLGNRAAPPSDRQRGLSGLSMALSRSLDGQRALAEKLPASDRQDFIDMGHLAHVLALPGEPTGMRALMRKLLEEEAARG